MVRKPRLEWKDNQIRFFSQISECDTSTYSLSDDNLDPKRYTTRAKVDFSSDVTFLHCVIYIYLDKALIE